MVSTDSQPSAEVPRAQVGQRILRATGIIMLVQVILRGFGLFEKMILGYLFKTSFITDAYMAARDIAFYLFQCVDQVIMHSFLPVFVQRMREHGEEDAWKLASATINLLITIVLVIAVLGVVFTPQLMPFFVPKWVEHPDKYAAGLIPLTIKLTRMMLVAVIFMSTSSLTYCLLNSYKKFSLPAMADLALKGTVLLFAVLFAKTWHSPFALALGFVVGAGAKIIIHGVGLRRKLSFYRPKVELKHPGLKQFFWLSLPLLIGVLASIFRQTMDGRFTSSLTEGSYAALKFARTLTDMPVQFFPFAFGIALFPFLADIALSGDKQRLREMLMVATRVMLIIFIPLTIAIITLRFAIVEVVFSGGSLKTAEPLPYYALGMLGGALEIIVLQFFFAQSDTLRPTIIGILMVPLHITTAWLGLNYFGLGILAIPIALLVSKGSKVIILYSMIRKKFESLEGRRTLGMLWKLAVALLVFALLLVGGAYILPPPDKLNLLITPHLGFLGKHAGKAAKALGLMPIGILTLVAFAAYATLLHVLRVEEMALLLSKVRGKMRKGNSAEPPQPATET